MYAQRKAPFTPRTHPGRGGGYRPAPVRARVGLAMRRGMNFGDLPDAEALLRSQGLSLAPMAVGDAGLSLGGTSVLPTAQASDIDSGALRALVVPAGAADPEGAAALDDAIARARARGIPVFAFGDGAAATVLAVLGRPAEAFDAPAVMFAGDTVELLADADALAAAARRVQ